MKWFLPISLIITYITTTVIGSIPPVGMNTYETCSGFYCLTYYKRFYYQYIENYDSSYTHSIRLTYADFTTFANAVLYFINVRKTYYVSLIEQAFQWCAKLALFSDGVCQHFHHSFYEKGYALDLIPDYCAQYELVCRNQHDLLVLSYTEKQHLEGVINFDECLTTAHLEKFPTNSLREIAVDNIEFAAIFKRKNENYPMKISCTCLQISALSEAFRIIHAALNDPQKSNSSYEEVYNFVASLCTNETTESYLHADRNDILGIAYEVTEVSFFLRNPHPLFHWLLTSNFPVPKHALVEDVKEIFIFFKRYYTLKKRT